MQVPDDPQAFENPEAVVGNVDLPPIETHSSNSWILMVVVMPTFSEGDEGKNEAVPAIVIGIKTSAPEHMRKRIDYAGRVEQNYCADKESPDQKLKPSDQEQHQPEEKRHKNIETIQEFEFGVAGEISNLVQVGWKVSWCSYPTHVRPPETVLPWRVHILFRIRETMVFSMMSCPPEWAPLSSCSAYHSEYELRDPRCLIAPV